MNIDTMRWLNLLDDLRHIRFEKLSNLDLIELKKLCSNVAIKTTNELFKRGIEELKDDEQSK